ncbi:unnamed protein product [Peniophora sp. CBMAI 1063]|nr:unnamed protein product [Peniophora sp. CBMAI 1063]
MAPRAPSAASQQQTARVRAEGRARQMCGAGPLTDVVDAALLRQELTQFYTRLEASDASPGRVALNRANRAFDYLSDASRATPRISKGAARIAWGLLLEEMKFAIKYNVTASVDPLVRFLAKARDEARRNHAWDMGKVRRLLADGWPSKQIVLLLPSHESGPVHWWLTVPEIQDKQPILRQAIYDAAYRLRSSASPRRRSPTPGPPTATQGGSRPQRQAANATNAALSATIIYDDHVDETYVPSDIPRDEDVPRPATFTFGANAASDFTAQAPAQASVILPPPPPPAAGARRAQPSPWLPPAGFTADLKWDIEDYNVLKAQLLSHPRGVPIPEGFLWEHPSLHGLRVYADGQPKMFEVRFDSANSRRLSLTCRIQVSCTNCRRKLRKCIGRGSKACLPCYWEKGSLGKCEGGVPPATPVVKPDFEVRKAFLEEVELATGEFPHHLVNKATGRARHGSDAAGTGNPPAYDPPAPRYSPPRPSIVAAVGEETPPASAPPAAQQRGNQVRGSVRDDQNADPGASNSASAPTNVSGVRGRRQRREPDSGGPDGVPSIAAAPGDSSNTAAPAVVQSSSDVVMPPASAVQPEDVAMADVTNAPDAAMADVTNVTDVAMADVSNVPLVRPPKRQRPSQLGEDERAEGADSPAVAPASRPRKRVKRPVPAQLSPVEEDPGEALPVAAPAADTPPAIVIPPRPRPVLSDSDQDETSRAASPMPRVAGRGSSGPANAKRADKGKAKALPKPRRTGTQQRDSAGAANQGIQFYDNVPGTRTVSRAGSPVFRARPWPAIPGPDMQVAGDRRHDIPSGITRITHPQPAPTPASAINLSGDIYLANHVERALREEVRDVRNEVRDIRDQDRDWWTGRYQNDFVLPRHREVLDCVRELQAEVRGLARTAGLRQDDGVRMPHNPGDVGTLDGAAQPSAAAQASGPTLQQSSPGSSVALQVSTDQGLVQMFNSLQTGLRNSFTSFGEEMRQSLTERTAPISDLHGSVQDLTRRFGELAPLTGRVDAMGQTLDAFGVDFRALVGRVQRLEDVGPLARNLRVFTEHQDRLGEAPVPMLVLREPVRAPNESAAEAHRSLSTVASTPEAAAVSSQGPPSVVEVRQSLGATSSSSPVEHSASRLHLAMTRDRDMLATVPANVSQPPSPNLSGPIVPPLPELNGMRSPGDLSPLTTTPSPGRQLAQATNEHSPTVQAHVLHSPGSQPAHSDGSSTEDDAPMETGDDWTLPASRKRSAEDAGDTARAQKRPAEEAHSDGQDEDAEGSSDDQAAPTTDAVSVAAQGKRTGRNVKSRGAGAAPDVAAPTPGRRTGLRTRAGRSG